MTPPHSPEANLTELSHDGPANEINIPTVMIDQLPPSAFDDSAALNTIFGTSSSVHIYRNVNQSSQASSQDTVHLRRRVREKGSGSKLEVVSSKIRKRFSKESRLKESSKTRSQKFNGGENGNAIQLNDILDDLTASQGGYDSDAEDIPTPQTVQEPMSGAIQVPPEYLNRLLRQIEKSQEVPLLEDRNKQRKLRIRRRRSKPADAQGGPEPNEIKGPGSQRFEPTLRNHVETKDSIRWRPPAFELRPESGPVPEPSTPKNKRTDSAVKVWEFGNDESPKDLMRRISKTVSERSPKSPPQSDTPRGRQTSIPEPQPIDWHLFLTAPRRGSSARRGQETSQDRVVAIGTLLDQGTSSGSIGAPHAPKDESQPSLKQEVTPSSGQKCDLTKDAGGTILTQPPVKNSIPDTPLTENHRTVKCICDFEKDDGNALSCEKCHTWQHLDCYYHNEELPEIHKCVACKSKSLDVMSAIEWQRRSRELNDNNGNDGEKSHTEQNSTGGSGRGGEEKSVHLFDMKISERLGSGSLLLGNLSRNDSKHEHSRRHSSLNSIGANPYHVRRVSGASSTGIMAPNQRPEWLTPRRDNASSFYLSQPGSLPSSGGSSVLHIPPLLDEWTKEKVDDRRRSLDRRAFDHTLLSVPGESEWMQRNTIDTNRSSTDSFRARELASIEVRFPTRRVSEPKESRFTEDFACPVRHGNMRSRSKSELVSNRHRQGSGMSRSTSDGWLSGGRRQGYGFEPVLEAQVPSPLPEDDAALLWERALKFHAEEAASNHSSTHALRHGSKPHSSLVRQRRARKSTRVVSPSVSSERCSSGEAAFTNTLAAPDFWLSPAGHAVLSKNEKKLGRFSNRSFPSWSRFPSHTRSARTDHAGFEDNVFARDFSPPQAVVPQGSPSGRGFRNKHRQKKKTKSMTFGKRNVFSKTYWQRLYHSHSSDVRRFQTGHRSSVSMGGKLEYPELEIIPGGELPYLVNEVRGLKREKSRLGNEIGNGMVLLHRDGSSWSWEDEGDKYRGLKKREAVVEKPSAKMWSRLYEECVDVAGRFGKDGATSGGCSHDGEGGEDDGTEQEFHDAPESSGALDADGGSAIAESMVSANGSVVVMPERAKTELRSEMSGCLRQLLEDEEKERAEAVRRAEDVLRAEDVYAM